MHDVASQVASIPHTLHTPRRLQRCQRLDNLVQSTPPCSQWAQWGIETLDQDLPCDARTLLGPNEPNHHLQANLTPDDAAALWPALQKVALPVVARVTAERQLPVCCPDQQGVPRDLVWSAPYVNS